jgi:hypothetical protein
MFGISLIPILGLVTNRSAPACTSSFSHAQTVGWEMTWWRFYFFPIEACTAAVGKLQLTQHVTVSAAVGFFFSRAPWQSSRKWIDPWSGVPVNASTATEMGIKRAPVMSGKMPQRGHAWNLPTKEATLALGCRKTAPYEYVL